MEELPITLHGAKALVICPCTGNTLGKLASGVADFDLVPDTVATALEGRQLQPLILGPVE